MRRYFSDDSFSNSALLQAFHPRAEELNDVGCFNYIKLIYYNIRPDRSAYRKQASQPKAEKEIQKSEIIMTYTFYSNAEGRYLIYDTASGAVIRSSEIEAYICDALDPCEEGAPSLPEKCPSEIRYELARFASTEVADAYARVKELYKAGLIYGISSKSLLRTSGEHSADGELISTVLSNAGLTKEEVDII